MTFAEWASEQPNPISLPAIVSSTDLFDGELFGDELIDIYNSSVGDGSDGKSFHYGDGSRCEYREESHLTHADASVLADIHLPDHKHKEVDEDHPMDDGLGAFRPSTSFNDLTVLPLLPPPSEADHAVTDTKIQALPKTTKKRGIQHNVEVPAAKRKATAPRGARRPTTKKVPGDAMLKAEVHPAPVDAVTSAALIAANEASKEEDTPNPLVPDVAASAANAAEDIVTDGGDDESLDKEPTEADFKSIAQAAVSNLIMSVSGTKTEESTAPSDDKEEDLTVDLSTAHIKALTGNNWVAACSNSSVTNSECSPVGGDSKANNRVRRQNLTADERAQQNRDRNREHARNTRLRKKAYVEELKRTLTELVAQRDVTDAEKRQSAQRELEQREVRFRVTEEFLKLRGRNEGNFARWSAILEEGFMLTLPVLNVYKMGKGETSSSGITLCGVSNVMEDAKNFSAFLQKSKANDDAAVAIQYKCDRKHFFMDGCNAFLEWTATATGSGKVRIT
jgi:hypothetical protein